MEYLRDLLAEHKRNRPPRGTERMVSNVLDDASGKTQAAADRYCHQLHLKPWAKSPEEAAWALMQRIMGLGQCDGRFYIGFHIVYGWRPPTRR